MDLFTAAVTLVARKSEDPAGIPLPLRTFSTPWAAFNLKLKPDIARISIDSLAEMYNLPDLRPALLDFSSKCFQNPSVHHIGGRRRTQMNAQPLFNDVMVWHSLRIQTQSLDTGSVTDPRRLTALPPCKLWPHGRYDTALFVHDNATAALSPGVGLDGKGSDQTYPSQSLTFFSRIHCCPDLSHPPSNLGYGASQCTSIPGLCPTI